jgi:hypothetical protein
LRYPARADRLFDRLTRFSGVKFPQARLEGENVPTMTENRLDRFSLCLSLVKVPSNQIFAVGNWWACKDMLIACFGAICEKSSSLNVNSFDGLLMMAFPDLRNSMTIFS